MARPHFRAAAPVHNGLNLFGTRLGILGFVLFALIFSGCVSSSKYEAEKARALNFQRLLAQEEKRTGELNVQVQETKRQIASLESQNRDLTVELQGVRDQLARAQDEASRMQEASGSPDMGRPEDDLTLSESSLSEFGLGDMDLGESEFKDFGTQDDLGAPPHTVVKGETLYGISRQYGVTVSDLKRWNNLDSNIISIGQQLKVSGP